MTCEPFYTADGMTGFTCGDEPPSTERCWICGAVADFLCDHPVFGSDGTCDVMMCRNHAAEVGEDRHYCGQHFTASP